MNKPIRTTVVFALVSGFLTLPLTELLSRYISYQAAFKWVLWMDLAIYAMLLARWSHTRRPLAILFPLALLLGEAFWPDTWIGFHALALGVLCWVRSGICYNGKLRALTAELVTVVVGITLVGTLGSNSMATWPLGLCLFILVQALYFYIIATDSDQKTKNAAQDTFDHARHEAEKVLAQLP